MRAIRRTLTLGACAGVVWVALFAAFHKPPSMRQGAIVIPASHIMMPQKGLVFRQADR